MLHTQKSQSALQGHYMKNVKNPHLKMMTTSPHFLLHQCHMEAWHLSLPGFPLVTGPLQFIPQPVSCLRMGFMGPRNSPQVLFESALHDIWHVLRLCWKTTTKEQSFCIWLCWFIQGARLYGDIISRHPTPSQTRLFTALLLPQSSG